MENEKYGYLRVDVLREDVPESYFIHCRKPSDNDVVTLMDSLKTADCRAVIMPWVAETIPLQAFQRLLADWPDYHITTPEEFDRFVFGNETEDSEVIANFIVKVE